MDFLNRDLSFRYKVALLILFIFIAMLSSSEYNLILGKVKVICPSCIGI